MGYRTARGLDKSVIRSLTQQSAWVGTRENIFVLGPKGASARALWRLRSLRMACRDGYSALYTRARSLFRDLAMARADGSLGGLLERLSLIDAIVINDCAIPPVVRNGAP
jgi:DNA replication protein DnaC